MQYLVIFLSIFLMAAEPVQRFVGVLHTGIMAIGGETTGTTLDVDGKTYELVLSKDTTAATLADKTGKRVVVIGTLEIKHGIERGERQMIVVHSLSQD